MMQMFCTVCGLRLGPTAPEKCPQCNSKGPFEEKEWEEVQPVAGPQGARYCTKCGYILISSYMPDRCPVCGEPGENFGYGTVSITPCEKSDSKFPDERRW